MVELSKMRYRYTDTSKKIDIGMTDWIIVEISKNVIHRYEQTDKHGDHQLKYFWDFKIFDTDTQIRENR